ncbi:unnamed protein product [Discosporangium mesarthrocarpum]
MGPHVIGIDIRCFLLPTLLSFERGFSFTGGFRSDQLSSLTEGKHLNEVEHARVCRGKAPHAFFSSVLTRKREQPPVPDDFIAHPVGPDVLSPGNEPFDSESLIFSSSKALFNPDECNRVIREAEDAWARGLTSSFTYKTNLEVHLADLPESLNWFNHALETTLFPSLRGLFPSALPSEASLLVYDALVIKYNATQAPGGQPVHRDNSLVSINIALNPEDEYEGGGTWMEPLQETIRIQQGGVLVHSSGLRHAGNPVVDGVRYILVCFVISDRLSCVDHARLFKSRGMIQRQEGRLVEALHSYGMGLEVNPLDSELWHSKGMVHAARKEVEDAKNCYQQSIDLNPADHKPLNNLGLLMMDEAFGDPLPIFLRAARVQPMDPSPFINAGLMLTRQERWQEAIGLLESGRGATLEHPDVRRLLQFSLQQLQQQQL